jgi:hypothetical protein
LKTFPKGRVIIDTSYPSHSKYFVDDFLNWKDFNPDTEDEISNDLPMSKGPKVRMTVYVDPDHAHDLVTRRSIAEILVMLNSTPIRWVSKRQKHNTIAYHRVQEAIAVKVLRFAYLRSEEIASDVLTKPLYNVVNP